MIWRICEAGLAKSAEDAKLQDVRLCEEILSMRYFAHVYDDYKRDPKTLTKDREEYLEAVERLTGQ